MTKLLMLNLLLILILCGTPFSVQQHQDELTNLNNQENFGPIDAVFGDRGAALENTDGSRSSTLGHNILAASGDDVEVLKAVEEEEENEYFESSVDGRTEPSKPAFDAVQNVAISGNSEEVLSDPVAVEYDGDTTNDDDDAAASVSDGVIEAAVEEDSSGTITADDSTATDEVAVENSMTDGDVATADDDDDDDDDDDAAADSTASPDQTKKKVPLREILLRLKPASLMDDEDRESVSAEKSQQEKVPLEQDDVVVAGTAISVEPVLPTNNNARVEDSSKGSNRSNASSRKAICSPADTTDNVQLLNATGLQLLVSPNPNISTRAVPAPCVLLFFFSEHCQFSVAAAPHVLAMAKGLQGIMPVFGVDTIQQHSVNAQYGVMGTPTLLLFHNGHSVAQYNASTYTGDLLSSFIKHFTDYKLEQNFNTSDVDIQDESVLPLQMTPGSRVWLVLSWLFLISVSCSCFLRSAFCHKIMEAVLNNWREAEAHQHQD